MVSQADLCSLRRNCGRAKSKWQRELSLAVGVQSGYARGVSRKDFSARIADREINVTGQANLVHPPDSTGNNHMITFLIHPCLVDCHGGR